jgi:transcriptional regulator with XRE-family HTH domain
LRHQEVKAMSMAGRMVRFARSRAALTQRALAAKSGIPQETIARIERGRADPRLKTLDRLLEACGYGLEVEPRLGIGVDRAQIRALLELSPSERLERALNVDREHSLLWRDLHRVAE